MASARPSRILIAGGGVAALEAMLAFHARAPRLAEVTLVAGRREFVYSPLSTGEPFERATVATYPLERLASEHRATFVEDAITAVEPGEHAVRTASGHRLAYDRAMLALGATREAVREDALTFADESSVPAFRELLARVRAGRTRSVAFVVPSGVVWPLPLYELILMTGAMVRQERLDVRLALVTPEASPLALFGPDASAAVSEMLAEHHVAVHAGSAADDASAAEDASAADEIVALPRLTGPFMPGLPATEAGFLPTDPRGRVVGVEDVHAAGDCADYPIKQGGLAAQQADIVVEDIVADLEGRPSPAPKPPVLRGMLLTGEGRTFVRAGEDLNAVSPAALWWPPAKVAGRYLAPALGFAEARARLEERAQQALVPIEIPVRPEGVMSDLG